MWPLVYAVVQWWASLSLFTQQLIVAASLMAASYALTPKPKAGPSAVAQQQTIPSADEGAAIPVIFGSVRVQQTCILAAHTTRTQRIREKVG